MKVQGTIMVIGKTQTFGSNGFEKRELVVQTHEQYPQTLMIEFVQGKVVELDKFQVGQDVTVSINLRGREWVNPQGETKYFNSIQGWRIEHMGTTNPNPQPSQSQQETPDLNVNLNETEEDDLPF